MIKKSRFALCIILLINLIFIPVDTAWAKQSYPKVPEVHGTSVILIEADTGAILYEKNSHKVLYPASITKVMTALLTIEKCSQNDMVTYSEKALSSLPFDAAKLGLIAGEELTVKDSLYALLLRSCNDIAVGLGEKISGSEKEFAKLMTERAKEAGALNTNFMNASGLHDDNHYTTAYDMAMITRAAISNPVFCEISGTSEYLLPKTNKCKEPRLQVNRHEALVQGKNGYYSYAIAGKTGYTDEAGRTLITVAKKDGKTLICVFMKTTDEYVYNDTKQLFEYGFNHFKRVNVSENETRFSGSEENFFVKMDALFSNSGALFNISKSDCIMVPDSYNIKDLTYKLEYDSTKSGIATINYYCGKYYMGTATLNIVKHTQSQIESESAAPVVNTQEEEENIINKIPINIRYVTLIAAIVVALIILIIYLVKTKEKRRRKRERKKMFKESKRRFRRRKKSIKF